MEKQLVWNDDCSDPAVCDTRHGDGYAVVPSDTGAGFVVIVGSMGDLVGYRRSGDGEWVEEFPAVEDAQAAAQDHYEAAQ